MKYRRGLTVVTGRQDDEQVYILIPSLPGTIRGDGAYLAGPDTEPVTADDPMADYLIGGLLLLAGFIAGVLLL